nr:hypothetical protein [Stutzerimonas kunmingensis]
MAAIDYLRAHGFSARVKGNRLSVSPASRITTSVRQYIKLHRLELLAEVAANDGDTRRTHWTVTFEDGRHFPMISPAPITYTEALADVRGRGCWPDADVLDI